MAEKKISAQPLFLWVDCSMNVFHNIMLSAVRELETQRDTQIRIGALSLLCNTPQCIPVMNPVIPP